MAKNKNDYSEIERVARERDAVGLTPGAPPDRHASPTPSNTIDKSKLPWNYLESDAGKALYHHYATLAYLRHTQAALQGNNFEPLLVDHERKLLAYQRWSDDGSVVVVAVNLTSQTQRATIPFPRPGDWHEWLHDYDDETGEEPHETDIPDSFGKIWVLKT